MELLVCYEDEGVYVNTYGRITKDVVLQWGEMPTSVGTCHPEGKAAFVKVEPSLNCVCASYLLYVLFRLWAISQNAWRVMVESEIGAGRNVL